jgi:hypothetical protein
MITIPLLMIAMLAATAAPALEIPEFTKGPTAFLSVGLGQGTYAIPTGYPGAPFRTEKVTTQEFLLDLRAARAIISGNLESIQHIGRGGTAQFRFSPVSIGPFAAGVGAQGAQAPHIAYEVPTSAYVRINAWHERTWVSGVVDAGIGGYDGNFLHALYLYGIIRTPTEVTVTMFDQPTILEHQGFGQNQTRTHGLGGEFRFLPIRRVVLAGSATHFTTHGGSALIAPEFTIVSGSISVRGPFHLGAMLSGTHATNILTIALPNNAVRLHIGLMF